MNLKESREVYMGSFGGEKGGRELSWLHHELKRKLNGVKSHRLCKALKTYHFLISFLYFSIADLMRFW